MGFWWWWTWHYGEDTATLPPVRLAAVRSLQPARTVGNGPRYHVVSQQPERTVEGEP